MQVCEEKNNIGSSFDLEVIERFVWIRGSALLGMDPSSYGRQGDKRGATNCRYRTILYEHLSPREPVTATPGPRAKVERRINSRAHFVASPCWIRIEAIYLGIGFAVADSLLRAQR